MRRCSASRFFGAEHRESFMNIATTRTFASPDGTGLPSLLISSAEPSLPSPGVLPASTEPPTDNSTQSKHNAEFEALLALFVLPQNLPLQLTRTATPTDVHGSIERPIAAVAQRLQRDVVAPGPTAATQKSTDAATSATTLTSVIAHPMDANSFRPAVESPDVALKSVLTPATTSSAAQMTPQGPSPSFAADSTTETLSEKREPKTPAEPQVQNTPSSALAEPPRIPATPTISDVPTASSRLMASDTGLSRSPLGWPAVERESASHSRDGFPLTDGLSMISSERTASGTFVESSARPAGFRSELLDRKPDRHRTAATDSAVLTELANSNPQAIEHSSPQLDSSSLAEHIAAAMQSRGEELSVGAPLVLQLRLDPPELGTVRVHLRLTDDAVAVRLIVADEAVTRILESQLSDLRQSLSERGLAFAQCDVMCDSQHRDSSNFGFERSAEPPMLAPIQPAPRTWAQPVIARFAASARTGHVDVWA